MEEVQDITFLGQLTKESISFLFNIAFIGVIGLALYLGRTPIGRLLDALNIKKLGVTKKGVTLERFEHTVEEAYTKQEMPPPSENDKKRIRNIYTHLVPVITGRRILWVDDNPSFNNVERAAFTQMNLDIQSCRSTDEAMTELRDPGLKYDVVISDWNREPSKSDLAEGLRLIELMNKENIHTPVIYYHGLVDEDTLQDRRDEAKLRGAVGTTGNPGQLLQWVVAELTRVALDDEQGYFIRDAD